LSMGRPTWLRFRRREQVLRSEDRCRFSVDIRGLVGKIF